MAQLQTSSTWCSSRATQQQLATATLRRQLAHHVCRAKRTSSSSSPQADTAPSTSAPAPGDAPAAAAPTAVPITRDLGRALGSRVVESNVAFKGPEDEADFWEGDRFDSFGRVLETYFVPGLIALGLVCGGIAAKTYNDGANAFLKPPTGPDSEPSIILALPEEGASAPSPIS